jgi:hypothetical protein
VTSPYGPPATITIRPGPQEWYTATVYDAGNQILGEWAMPGYLLAALRGETGRVTLIENQVWIALEEKTDESTP